MNKVNLNINSKLVGQCVLCVNRAGESCRLCGARVCSKHFDYNKNVCVSCKVGKII